MCGFSGEINIASGSARVDAVARMTDTMAARGPDAVGIFGHQHVAMGHRRLKIIDVSDRSRQPLTDPALGLTVTFNGCIYNYRDLRAELEGMGYQFFSGGDTEVIAKAFHAWGPDCVQRFMGMFAFAIHELESGSVTLARDRLGIKPLYIARPGRGDRIRYASSLPALLAGGDIDTSLNPAALHHYFSFHSVVPAPLTLLNGVEKIPPATIVRFDRDGRRDERRYWQLEFPDNADDARKSAEDWCALVRDGLQTAVERRMVSDVPVGVLLSGGLDSSLIVALLARNGAHGLNTFSIGFDTVDDEVGDEFQYSDIIAETFGTEHHRMHIAPERVLDNLPAAIAAMSEPMTSHDNIAFYLLSQEVARHVKVVQSGQGADEVFAGYHWYPPLLDNAGGADAYAGVFFDRSHAEMGELLQQAFVDKDYSREFLHAHFAAPGASRLIDQALRLDIQVMLADDPVKRLDNMTMAAGLEARVPFLDHELVELAARIPAELKIADGGKGILKAAARGVVPDAVIDRPKGYFPVPALKYIEGPYLDMVRDTMNSRAARERGLVRREYMDMLLEDPKAHITPLRGSKLWQVSLLEMWLQNHGL